MTTRYIMYCRKSSKGEGRQVLSIESQIKELQRLADKLGLEVAEVVTEAASAMHPGRPVFNSMMARIESGDASGIICWRMDRLSRNPVDEGRIKFLLREGVLEHIQTPGDSFRSGDNVFNVGFQLLVADQDVRTLRTNVIRGLKTKVEKGWYPGQAPLGYLNNPHAKKGLRTVEKDPERFVLVRRVWDEVLAGCPPTEVLKRATDTWGLRTKTGRIIGRSSFYKLLANPFYSGAFEYPGGSGNWYEGAHKAMVTADEYEEVQLMLGRKGRPRPKSRTFTYRGLITCGECGGSVTAEWKEHTTCSSCGMKFSSTNRDACPGCELEILEMARPIRRSYTYYHCTKNKDPQCSQKTLEVRKLEEQILGYLRRLQMDDAFSGVVQQTLKAAAIELEATEKETRRSQERELARAEFALDKLVDMKLAPENADGSQISDEEYAKKRKTLVQKARSLRQGLEDAKASADREKRKREAALILANTAASTFETGSADEKRGVLQQLRAKIELLDKRVSIEVEKPLCFREMKSAHASGKNVCAERESYVPNPVAQLA